MAAKNRVKNEGATRLDWPGLAWIFDRQVALEMVSGGWLLLKISFSLGRIRSDPEESDRTRPEATWAFVSVRRRSGAFIAFIEGREAAKTRRSKGEKRAKIGSRDVRPIGNSGIRTGFRFWLMQVVDGEESDIHKESFLSRNAGRGWEIAKTRRTQRDKWVAKLGLLLHKYNYPAGLSLTVWNDD